MFFYGCSSENSISEKKPLLIEAEDKYDYSLDHSSELKEVILKIVFIFENNPNTKFPVFYFKKNDAVFKIYYYDDKRGRTWCPSLNIETEAEDSPISILNLYLKNKKEDPEIKIDHNENIVINRKNYKENEKEIIFLFQNYLSFLEKIVSDRDNSFKKLLTDLNSVNK